MPLFIKPGLVILHDVLSAAQDSAQYDWLLHTVAPIDIDAATQGFRLTSGQARLSGRFLTPQKVDLAVKAGYPVEPVDGYSTRPVPPDQYAHEWTLTATPQSKRGNEEFLVALQIQREGDTDSATFEAIPTQDGLAAQCKTPQQTTLVCFRQRGQTGLLQAADASSRPRGSFTEVWTSGRRSNTPLTSTVRATGNGAGVTMDTIAARWPPAECPTSTTRDGDRRVASTASASRHSVTISPREQAGARVYSSAANDQPRATAPGAR